jgi:K+-transporting ATPase ATPase C chain
MPSGGSNFGPTSSKLKQQIVDRKAQWVKSNPTSDPEKISSEMLLASASGLDPHISPKAALMQVERIVKARQFGNDKKQQILKAITELSEAPQFLILGENRINVLALNLELDKLSN